MWNQFPVDPSERSATISTKYISMSDRLRWQSHFARHQQDEAFPFFLRELILLEAEALKYVGWQSQNVN